MTNLELAKGELDRLDVFDGKLNSTALSMTKILGDDIPFTMALTIANYTMASFIGHFHYKIKMAEDNLVPANMIAFILAKSGAKKTSSVLKLEKALSKGYEVINNFRIRQEKERADEAGCAPRRINPLANALATEAGMIKRLNDFKREGIGLPSMFVDEISTELATNPDIVPNIKLVSQLFDIGEMKSKPLKDSDNQSDEVNGMGMNALFIGSEHGLLEDTSVLKMFETEFISKLSRRCFFVYPEFKSDDIKFDDISQLLKHRKELKQNSGNVSDDINHLAHKIASAVIEEDIRLIELDEKASDLYEIYTVYCEEMANLIDNEALNLEQQHRHWKAFKLSGIYAVFNGRTKIMMEDLKEAINAAELTSGDLEKFIYKAKRETYEIVLDHFIDGGQEVTTHEMVKKGWIKKQSDLKNIIINANSKLGRVGMLEEIDDKVMYKIHKSNKGGVGASYKIVSGTKEERAFKCADGFTYKVTTFEKLGNLLCNDTAYTPFEFAKGIRGKDNVVGGAEFVVLDVDDSDITYKECHDLLADYKHCIAKTSNYENPYKFRCIIPLDIIVELNSTKWRVFMEKVSNHLGIKIDLLPQSQIYYGFANRELLVNNDGIELEASELIKDLGEPIKVVQPVSAQKRNSIWNNRMSEFAYAYKGREGGRSLHNGLFNAMRHAYDLGFSYQENVDLTDDIISKLDEKPRDNFIPSLESQRRRLYAMD